MPGKRFHLAYVLQALLKTWTDSFDISWPKKGGTSDSKGMGTLKKIPKFYFIMANFILAKLKVSTMLHCTLQAFVNNQGKIAMRVNTQSECIIHSENRMILNCAKENDQKKEQATERNLSLPETPACSIQRDAHFLKTNQENELLEAISCEFMAQSIQNKALEHLPTHSVRPILP